MGQITGDLQLCPVPSGKEVKHQIAGVQSTTPVDRKTTTSVTVIMNNLKATHSVMSVHITVSTDRLYCFSSN